MRRKVSISTFGTGAIDTGEIVIDKNGMRVEGKHPSYQKDDSFISEYISDCLNTDGWNYSWEINVSDAKYRSLKKGKKVRRKIKKIILNKIEKRKAEIQQLKDGLNILSRWHY